MDQMESEILEMSIGEARYQATRQEERRVFNAAAPIANIGRVCGM
jgi:hypothetical protein